MKTVEVKKIKSGYDDRIYELKLKHNDHQSTVLALTLKEMQLLKSIINKLIK